MVYIKGSIFTIPRPKPLASIPFVPDVETIRKFIQGEIGIADNVMKQMMNRQIESLEVNKANEIAKLLNAAMLAKKELALLKDNRTLEQLTNEKNTLQKEIDLWEKAKVAGESNKNTSNDSNNQTLGKSTPLSDEIETKTSLDELNKNPYLKTYNNLKVKIYINKIKGTVKVLDKKIKKKEESENKPGAALTNNPKSDKTESDLIDSSKPNEGGITPEQEQQIAEINSQFEVLKNQLLANAQYPAGVGLKALEAAALQSMFSAEGPLTDIVLILLGMLKTIEDCICRVMMRQNPAKYWWSLNYQQINLKLIIDKMSAGFTPPKVVNLQKQVMDLKKLVENLKDSDIPVAQDLVCCALKDVQVLEEELRKETCKETKPLLFPNFLKTIEGFVSDLEDTPPPVLKKSVLYAGYFDNNGNSVQPPEWITGSTKWIPGVSDSPDLIDLEAPDSFNNVRDYLLKDFDMTPGTVSPFDTLSVDYLKDFVQILDQSKLTPEEKDRLCNCVKEDFNNSTEISKDPDWEDTVIIDDIPEWQEMQDLLLDIPNTIKEAFPLSPQVSGPPISVIDDSGDEEIMTDEEGNPIKQSDNVSMLLNQMRSSAQIKKQIGLAILVHWAYSGRGNIGDIWELLYGQEWRLRNAVPKSLQKLVNSFKKIEEKLALVPTKIGKRLRKLWTKRFLKKLRAFLNASNRVQQAARILVESSPRSIRIINSPLNINRFYSSKKVAVPPRISKGGFFPKTFKDSSGQEISLDLEGEYELRVVRIEGDPTKYGFDYYNNLVNNIKQIKATSGDRIGPNRLVKGVYNTNQLFLYQIVPFTLDKLSQIVSVTQTNSVLRVLPNCPLSQWIVSSQNEPYKITQTFANWFWEGSVKTPSGNISVSFKTDSIDPVVLKEKITGIVSQSWEEISHTLWEERLVNAPIPLGTVSLVNWLDLFEKKSAISLDSSSPKTGIVLEKTSKGIRLDRSWFVTGQTGWSTLFPLDEWFISLQASNVTTYTTTPNRTLWSVLKKRVGLVGSNLDSLSIEELGVYINEPLTQIGQPVPELNEENLPETLPDIEALVPLCLAPGLDPRYLDKMIPNSLEWDQYKAFWLIEAHAVSDDVEGGEEESGDTNGSFDAQTASFMGPDRGSISPSRYKARHIVTGYTKFMKQFLKTVIKKFFPTIQRLIEIIQDPRKIGELLGLIVQTRLRENFVLFDTERMYNDIDISSNYTYFDKGFVKRADNEVVSTIIDGIATVTIPGFFTIGFKIEKGLLTFILKRSKKKCRFPSSIIQALLGILMTPIKVLISIIKEIIAFVKGLMKITSAVKTLKWFMSFRWLICILKPFNLLKLLGLNMDIPKLLSGRASSEGCIRQDPDYFAKSIGKGPCQETADKAEDEFTRGMDAMGLMIEMIQTLPESALPWLNWDTLPLVGDVGIGAFCEKTGCLIKEKYPQLVNELAESYNKPNGELDLLAVGVLAYRAGCDCLENQLSDKPDTIDLDKVLDAGINLISDICEPQVTEPSGKKCRRPETEKFLAQASFKWGMLLKEFAPDITLDKSAIQNLPAEKRKNLEKKAEDLKKSKKDRWEKEKEAVTKTPKDPLQEEVKPLDDAPEQRADKSGKKPGEDSGSDLPNPVIGNCVNLEDLDFLTILELLGVKKTFDPKKVDLAGLKALMPAQFRKVNLEDLSNMSYATILQKCKPKLISLSDVLSMPLFGQDLPKYTPEEMKEMVFLPLEMIVGPLQLVEDTINGLIIFIWSLFGLNGVIQPVPMLNIVCKIPKFEWDKPIIKPNNLENLDDLDNLVIKNPLEQTLEESNDPNDPLNKIIENLGINVNSVSGALNTSISGINPMEAFETLLSKLSNPLENLGIPLLNIWDPLKKTSFKIKRIPRCPVKEHYNLPKSSDPYLPASGWDQERLSDTAIALGTLPEGILEGCGCDKDLIKALKETTVPIFSEARFSNPVFEPYKQSEKTEDYRELNIGKDDDESEPLYKPWEDPDNPYAADGKKPV